MVKFRGIEISIISQFDICKLPEFRLRQTTPQSDPFRELGFSSSSNAVASCYVPIYAGSQGKLANEDVATSDDPPVWFEYSIDGPHPPEGKGYLFKLFIDGQFVISWDCTEKHDHHGKMMYNLICEGKNEDTGAAQLTREALKFSDVDPSAEPSEQQDVAEIRIHRIEHRQRAREVEVRLGRTEYKAKSENGLRLTEGGLLEPGFPQRRYKYQILDPIDDPYATFRFHYRTIDYLKRHGIVESATDSTSSSIISADCKDASSTLRAPEDAEHTVDSVNLIASTTHEASVSPFAVAKKGPSECTSQKSDSFVPPSDSEESLSLVTKDSIEDLSSMVPKSPKTPHASAPPKPPHSPNKSPQTFEEIIDYQTNDEPVPPPSPSKFSMSPRRLLKKKLTVNINGTDFNIERKKRPLSPFNGGGKLRKLVPPSAPPALTEFGPTVKDEVEKLEERMRKTDEDVPAVPKDVRRSTRAERGGRQLMGFLNRRLGRE